MYRQLNQSRNAFAIDQNHIEADLKHKDAELAHLNEIITGKGSYTFTAWLKPRDLSGDKFLFGQTSQGIHNGIYQRSQSFAIFFASFAIAKNLVLRSTV